MIFSNGQQLFSYKTTGDSNTGQITLLALATSDVTQNQCDQKI
jgi:hypothetical protein